MHSRNLGRTVFGDPANTGNLMPLEEAHALLNEWVPNERLRLHMKQVAANMKAWALEKEGADELTARKWELAGLLHDADWEKYPDDHCRIIIEELEKRQIDPEVIRHLLGRRRDPLRRLTPREREVLALMAQGHSNAAIAQALTVSPAAVGKHINGLLAKLDLPPDADVHRRVLAVLTYLRS